ncbi:hypothetical protein M404DRAFT_29454 [Pisolithus tinctorius Marx 270]|uniref:Uncharacterized protein n=1 Tax=Pisolithus tinctorius Marx 270 TaxID=870435 RepID=A0A0C3NHN8_PISTI|nr:hypothetical protein M404DRAFT_29454 [Pisolithus tinctorius Marx 270]
MSVNHAPRLSQLVRAATPDPAEVEKATLKVRFIVASAALVAEARCLPDDKEELWEEKVMWMCQWEERTGEVYPIIKRGQELGIDTKIDAVDGPTIAEANEAYERWVAEEIAHGKADKDVQMGEEAVSEQGPGRFESLKRSWQTIAESEDEGNPKINVPPSSILHKVPCTCCLVRNAVCMGPTGHTWMKQRCKKSTKAVGKRVQAGTSVTQASKTVKAGPSKRTVDNNEVEVVESHMCAKGKAPVHIAEAAESQATYLHLQVRVNQLAEALEKIGVD